MCLPIETSAAAGLPADVHYEWDPETELLAAQVRRQPSRPSHDESDPVCAPDARISGSVEIQGHDGSWITLDVRLNRIDGVAIAAWPRIVRRHGLVAPADAQHVHATVSVPRRHPSSALEIVTSLTAEVDDSWQTVHFSLLRPPAATAHRSNGVRSVRIARDILLDVDGDRRLTGLWLLNVPPDSIPVP